VGAVCCAATLLVLGGCSGTLSLEAPRLDGAAAKACATLVADLPPRVDSQRRRDVDAGHGFGAAWGDPAIELRCGVRRPAGLDAFAQCQVVDGVGWYIPDSQITGRPEDITMTTVGRAEYVEVRVPRDYFPPAATMVDLAPAVKRSVKELRPCQ